MKSVKTDGMEVNMTLGAHIRDESKTLDQWKVWTLVGERDDLGGWVELSWGEGSVWFYLHVGEGAGQGAGTRPPLLLQCSAEHLKLPLLLPH